MIISDRVGDCICLEWKTMPAVTFILTHRTYTKITVEPLQNRDKQAADDSCVRGVFKRYKHTTQNSDCSDLIGEMVNSAKKR